jgi:hypothetical protein
MQIWKNSYTGQTIWTITYLDAESISEFYKLGLKIDEPDFTSTDKTDHTLRLHIDSECSYSLRIGELIIIYETGNLNWKESETALQLDGFRKINEYTEGAYINIYGQDDGSGITIFIDANSGEDVCSVSYTTRGEAILAAVFNRNTTLSGKPLHYYRTIDLKNIALATQEK